MPEAGAKHATPRESDASSSTSTEARQGQHHDVTFKSVVFYMRRNVTQSTNCCCLCKDTRHMSTRSYASGRGRTPSRPPEVVECVKRRAEGANPSSSDVTRSCRRRSRGTSGVESLSHHTQWEHQNTTHNQRSTQVPSGHAHRNVRAFETLH